MTLPCEALIRLLLFATMAVWGLNLSAVKVLSGRVDTLVLAGLRMTAAALVMTGFVAPRLAALGRLDRRRWAGLAACAALMVYANQLLLLTGVRLSSATNAALVIALSPIAALLVAVLLFRERLGRARILGMILGFAGVAVVTLGRPLAAVTGAGLGDLLILLSVLTFALGGALIQHLARDVDPFVISWAVHVVGAGMLGVHALLAGGPGPAELQALPAWGWGVLLASGVVSTGLGGIVWTLSVSTLGVSRTTASVYWIPVFGVAFAVGALGEAASVWHAVGLAGVMAGTWLSLGAAPLRVDAVP